MNDSPAETTPDPAAEATTEPPENEAANEVTDPESETANPADVDTVAETDAPTPASREAAKYRRRLRETEGERDRLIQRLATLQRVEAERIAAQHLADGADIWRDGADIEALLDGDGNLDPSKVSELAAATAAAHPHWVKRALPPVIPRGDFASGASNRTDLAGPTWAQILRGAGR